MCIILFLNLTIVLRSGPNNSQKFPYRLSGCIRTTVAPRAGAQGGLDMPWSIKEIEFQFSEDLSPDLMLFLIGLLSLLFKHRYFNIYVFMCLYP